MRDAIDSVSHKQRLYLTGCTKDCKDCIMDVQLLADMAISEYFPKFMHKKCLKLKSPEISCCVNW